MMCSKIKNCENVKTSRNANDSEVVNTLSISSKYLVSYLQTQRSYIKNSYAKECNSIPQGKITLLQILFSAKKFSFRQT